MTLSREEFCELLTKELAERKKAKHKAANRDLAEYHFSKRYRHIRDAVNGNYGKNPKIF